MKTDKEITLDFINMISLKGVKIKYSYDEGNEYTILSNNSPFPNKETLTFCFDDDGNFNRIMGYVGDYFSDEVFKI
jgi:hypothetical protein